MTLKNLFKHAILYIVMLILFIQLASATVDYGETADLSITIFFLSITFGIFYLSSKNFTQNIFANLIIKRSLIVLGMYMMTLNSAVMAVIANAAGLTLTKELFMIMWLFGYGGYLAIVFLVLKTLFDVLKEWDLYKTKKQMGDSDE